MTQETVTNGTEALFTREGMPPVKEMIPCALQHVLASFAGIITPAVIMAGVYGFNSQQSTDIIQVALILSAIDTALQAFAPFRRIGGGLPIVMGVSFAFLPALQAMGASGFSFGALLGGEIVGGAVAVLFGLAYSKIKWLFPPVVTGTVIFSIGVSLYPTAVKYMAGGAGSWRGTGGMATKLRAARMETGSGADMVIANGAHPELLYDIAAGRSAGTRFAARKED